MERRGNGLGITGFVLGLFSIVFFWTFIFTPFTLIAGILGIIFSSIQIKRNSNGLAIAGLILSILGLLATISFIATIVLAIFTSSNDFSVDEINRTVVLITNDYEYIKDGKLYTSKFGGSGVIYYNEEGTMRAITNKHVIDCSQEPDYCGQLTKQRMSVRTYDGKVYNVSKLYISPNGLDLAVLEVNVTINYTAATLADEIDKESKVVAIGYPGFASNAREFSIGFGKITNTRSLITPEGYEFEAIDSNAYINFGSSGGGLFDESKKLIGITTWGDGQYSYAINIKSLGDINTFSYCKNGEYYSGDAGCLPLCEGIIDSNNRCVLPCDDFYCKSEQINANDNMCADSSLVYSEKDGFCHQACGNKESYCPGDFSYCFENKCTACPNGYILYQNGKCY